MNLLLSQYLFPLRLEDYSRHVGKVGYCFLSPNVLSGNTECLGANAKPSSRISFQLGQHRKEGKDKMKAPKTDNEIRSTTGGC